MRIVGLAGLVLVMLIVGIGIKRQATDHRTPMTPDTSEPGSDVSSRTRRAQQDVQHFVDAAMRTPRDVPNGTR